MILSPAVRTLKVLIATTHLDKGGIAFYTVNLARGLRPYGVGTAVLSSGGELGATLEREGIPSMELPIRTKSEFGPKMWMSLPAAARYARREGFDLVHAQTRVTQIMAEGIYRLTGIPYVTTCHGFFKHRRLSRRMIPGWGKKVIAISESVKRHLLSDMLVPEDRVELVYNGIDTSAYSGHADDKRREILVESGLKYNSTVIGSVGRFSSAKGLKYLLEAFGMVASKNSNVSLLLVGQGPEEDELLKIADSLHCPGRIGLARGTRPLNEYLSAIDIFCMPSITEGFGLAAVEAMASGKPCVVSRVGGLTEIVVDGESGITVPPGSAREIAEAVESLLKDEDLLKRLSSGARLRASEFSLEKCVEGTLRVYRSALSGIKKKV